MSKRVLVCGGRNYNDYDSLEDVLFLHTAPGDVIIHGGASGADAMAGRFARERDRIEAAMPADWKTHGLAAGPLRNRRMLVEGKPDLVIAFPGGKGTADMVARAQRAGVTLLIVPG